MSSPEYIALNEPLHKPWRKVVVLSVFLTCVCLGALEFGARQMGALPSVSASSSFWARERSRADLHQPKSLVLIGSSRFKEALNPEVLASYLPQHKSIHQLAINGGNALPLLEHLAQDPTFHGDLLVEILPLSLSHTRPNHSPTEDCLKHYEQRALYSSFENELSAFVQGNIAILSQSADFKKWMKLRRFSSDSMVMERRESARRIKHQTTEYAAYDEKKDMGWVTLWRSMFEPLSTQQTDQTLERWRVAAEALKARGSSLTFFRINSSAHVYAFEKKLAARDQFYDRWQRTIGGRWIHFTDDPILSSLTCYDGSHVMGKDAITLNHRLGELLAAQEASSGE